ncbi:MAG: hypothetical protein HY671_04945 [Chloroflexi bacterium]|nr:hypothetical protein [Chloroflexota bacterium]
MAFLIGARRLSQLAIDADKDWLGRSLVKLGSLNPIQDAVQDLNSASKRWWRAWVRDLTVTNSISADGVTIDLGAGGLVKFGADTLLQRLAADVLGSPDTILVIDSGYFSGRGAAAEYTKFDAYVSGDSYQRFLIRADGLMSWGPGNAPLDVSLYRESADFLRLSKALYCAAVARIRGTGAGSVGGDAVLEKATTGGLLYIWNVIDAKGMWLDFAAGALKFAANFNQVLPSADNIGSLGTDSARWALIRGVNITGGDLGLENGWAFTEDPVHGVALKSPQGKRYRLLLEPM